jgi:hypothetical protein
MGHQDGLPMAMFPLSLSINTTNVNSPHMSTTTTTDSSITSSNVTSVTSQAQASASAKNQNSLNVTQESSEQRAAGSGQLLRRWGGVLGVMGVLLWGLVKGLWAVLGGMRSVLVHVLVLKAAFAAASAAKSAKGVHVVGDATDTRISA